MKQKICREREYFRQDVCLKLLDAQKRTVDLGGFARTHLENCAKPLQSGIVFANLNCLNLFMQFKNMTRAIELL
jgi:hypothetical protein